MPCRVAVSKTRKVDKHSACTQHLAVRNTNSNFFDDGPQLATIVLHVLRILDEPFHFLDQVVTLEQ